MFTLGSHIFGINHFVKKLYRLTRRTECKMYSADSLSKNLTFVYVLRSPFCFTTFVHTMSFLPASEHNYFFYWSRIIPFYISGKLCVNATRYKIHLKTVSTVTCEPNNNSRLFLWYTISKSLVLRPSGAISTKSRNARTNSKWQRFEQTHWLKSWNYVMIDCT